MRQNAKKLILWKLKDEAVLVPAHPGTHTHTQLFYVSLDFVWDNAVEPVPEETFTHSHSSWSSIIPIRLIHPTPSMLSSLLNPRARQSLSTISLQVFLGLPLGLVPSTSHSIHLLTQSWYLNHGLPLATHAHNIAACSAAAPKPCHLIPVSLLTFMWNSIMLLHATTKPPGMQASIFGACPNLG